MHQMPKRKKAPNRPSGVLFYDKVHLYIFTFCLPWLWSTSNIRKTFLRCSVTTGVQNYMNALLRISVRGGNCRQILSWGPPSGHWSSGTAQSSTSHSAAALTGSNDNYERLLHMSKTTKKEEVVLYKTPLFYEHFPAVYPGVLTMTEH